MPLTATLPALNCFPAEISSVFHEIRVNQADFTPPRPTIKCLDRLLSKEYL